MTMKMKMKTITANNTRKKQNNKMPMIPTMMQVKVQVKEQQPLQPPPLLLLNRLRVTSPGKNTVHAVQCFGHVHGGCSCSGIIFDGQNFIQGSCGRYLIQGSEIFQLPG